MSNDTKVEEREKKIYYLRDAIDEIANPERYWINNTCFQRKTWWFKHRFRIDYCWQYDMMTRWHYDIITLWHDKKMTRWNDDMTGIEIRTSVSDEKPNDKHSF